METILFQKHEGLLNTDDQSVTFYGISFKNIIDSIKILKHFPAKYNTYTGWYYNYNKGVLNRVTGEIFIDLRWLPNEKFAEEYVDTKKNNN